MKFKLITLIAVLSFLFSCSSDSNEDNGNSMSPTITTSEIITITETSASSGGTITTDGGATITAQGVCWSTLENPTIADNKTIDGTTTSFTSNLSSLVNGTTYYVRAYATNSFGTAYGNQLSFRTIETNYLPIAIGDYWTYNVTTNAQTQRDSLYISNDTTINAKTYKKFKTKNAPIGFFSNSLNKNGLRKENRSLLLTGTLALDFGVGVLINLSVTDFVIFNENATNNQQLGTVTGTINQTVQTYPLVIDYTLKSIAIETLPTYSSNGRVYSDVKRVKTILNAKITTTVSVSGFPITATILSPQDVVVSNQYYAKNIGMVHTNTLINYQLNSIPGGITLPIPSTGSQTQDEFLDVYDVSN